MQWRTVFVIASIGSGAVICITHYRGPKPAVPDPIAPFRRILTVTNMMFLAGNRPHDPDGNTQPVGRARKAQGRTRRTHRKVRAVD